MLATFHISVTVDDAGVAEYRAVLPSGLDENGVPRKRVIAGLGENVWIAIGQLCARAELADIDERELLLSGEEEDL